MRRRIEILAAILILSCLPMHTLADDLRNYLTRSLITWHAYFNEPQQAGGWVRTDRITNSSLNRTLLVEQVQVLVLNPEQVGFSDIFGPQFGTTNVFQVVAAAAQLNPTYYFFGANWWETADRPEVTWTPNIMQIGTGLTPSFPFPLILFPGQSFEVESTTFGISPVPATSFALTGEQVLGWQFSGQIISVPEPSTFISLGAIAIGFSMVLWRKRHPLSRRLAIRK